MENEDSGPQLEAAVCRVLLRVDDEAGCRWADHASKKGNVGAKLGENRVRGSRSERKGAADSGIASLNSDSA